MSRVAKMPVKLPAGVQVSKADGQLTVKSAKTSLTIGAVTIEANGVAIRRCRIGKALHAQIDRRQHVPSPAIGRIGGEMGFRPRHQFVDRTVGRILGQPLAERLRRQIGRAELAVEAQLTSGTTNTAAVATSLAATDARLAEASPATSALSRRRMRRAISARASVTSAGWIKPRAASRSSSDN